MKSDDASDGFFPLWKTLFKGKTVEIAVHGTDKGSEDETAYLLRDPANRRRLMRAIKNVRQGQTVEVERI